MTTISTTGLSTSGFEPPAASLSRAEVAEVVRSLSAGDKTALTKIARFYAKKTPYDHEDLLQEAICRVLGGTRAWPRSVPPVAFFWGVVRSIAWEWRTMLIEAEPEGADFAAEERRKHAAIDAARIIALFDDDPVAQVIVQGMMEGARGQELQELSGLDKTEYESKRTKIRRRIEKLPM